MYAGFEAPVCKQDFSWENYSLYVYWQKIYKEHYPRNFYSVASLALEIMCWFLNRIGVCRISCCTWTPTSWSCWARPGQPTSGNTSQTTGSTNQTICSTTISTSSRPTSGVALTYQQDPSVVRHWHTYFLDPENESFNSLRCYNKLVKFLLLVHSQEVNASNVFC